MKIKKFFKILEKYYYVDFDENGKWNIPYAVKYYCQVSTFSYEIYDPTNAFVGKPTYESEVFSFWNNKKGRQEILDDIKKNLKLLK